MKGIRRSIMFCCGDPWRENMKTVDKVYRLVCVTHKLSIHLRLSGSYQGHCLKLPDSQQEVWRKGNDVER